MRIASYNLCNLFDPLDPNTPTKHNRETRAAAEVLTMMDADIVVIQEVASENALASVNERLKSPYPVVRVIEGNYYRGLHLGVMSKYPIDITSHQDTQLTDVNGQLVYDYASPADAEKEIISELRFQRDLLRIDTKLDDDSALSIFCVHLKSHSKAAWRLLENDAIRTAEVNGVIRVMQEWFVANPGRPGLLAGDLNETSSRPLLKHLIETLGLVDVLERDWVLAGHKPSYSYQNYPSRARLDYLLMNSGAMKCYTPGSAKIHGTPSGRVASDHYPVSIEIESVIRQ